MKTLGKFEVLEKIGQGAMGIVYKGRDPFIGRLVALKTITTGLDDDPALLQRFYQEARSAGTLEHPNIVIIYELGKEGDTPFIAMQFLEGESLEKLLERRSTLPLSQKIGFIVYVCRALEYAHKRGVVHRDIKPGNVMVSPDGTVRVVDFGIARLENSGRTRTGLLIGTLGYMSPQQFRNIPADARSDIWSVGIMFHEILAGRRPFAGDNPGTLMMNILMKEPPSITAAAPGTPQEVAAVIERMLKKEVEERFQSMGEVLMELDPIWKRVQQAEASGLVRHSEALLEARSERVRHEQKQRLEQWTEKVSHCIDAGRFAEAVHAAESALVEFPQNLDLMILLTRAKTQKEEKEKQELLDRRLNEVTRKIESGELTDAIDLARQTLATLGPNHELSLRLRYAEVEIEQREKKKREQRETLQTARILVDAGKFGDATMILQQAVETRIFTDSDPLLNDLLQEIETKILPPPPPAVPPVPNTSGLGPEPWPMPSGDSGKDYVYNQRGGASPETQIAPPTHHKEKKSSGESGKSKQQRQTPAQSDQFDATRFAAPAQQEKISISSSLYEQSQSSPDLQQITANSVTIATQEKTTASPWRSRILMIAAAAVAALVILATIWPQTNVTHDDSLADQYQKACDGGDMSGCTQLGDMYRDGQGVGRENNRAIQLFQKGCDGGNQYGCFNLAAMYESGIGLARDDKLAAQLYQRACGLGNGPACVAVEHLRSPKATENTVPARISAPKLPVGVTQNNSVKSVQDACDKGNVVSCDSLGVMYANGQGVAENDIRAVQLFKRSCNGDAAVGCNNLGIMYENGQGVRIDERHAVQLYQKSCDGGNAHGCNNLGMMFQDGKGVPKDERRALQSYQKACDLGGAEGCANKSSVNNGFGRSTSPPVQAPQNNSVTSFQDACDKGNAVGCDSLGVMYANGQGVPENDIRAVQLFQKSCDGNSAVGCNNLGIMFENGQGVGKDERRAVQIYQKSCDGGNAHGCNNLGMMYQNGQGVAKDDRRALLSYQKACDLGDAEGCANKSSLNNSLGKSTSPPAQPLQNNSVKSVQDACDKGIAVGCNSLGVMYQNGQGVARDLGRAVVLYQKGCDGGIAQGCTNLGYMYMMGQGVERDNNHAAQLYKKACSLGDTRGC